MYRKLVVIGVTSIVILFTVSVSGCSNNSGSSYNTNPTSPSNNPGGGSTVTMSSSTFSPSTLTITRGTTVTWKNNDSFAHTATSDNGTWDTGNMAGGATTTTTFSSAGTFHYHCTYHQAMGMVGTVVVQ